METARLDASVAFVRKIAFYFHASWCLEEAWAFVRKDSAWMELVNHVT
jgi:hypothetical protein